MALLMSISAKPRWWVIPLIMACNGLARIGVMKSRHAEPVIEFVRKRGIKIMPEKS
jgi:hypothetical protein